MSKFEHVSDGVTLPPRIPDHKLIRHIGEGSYGEVWLARNVMGTPRAVKVVYRKTFEDERPYEREFEGIRRFEPISRTHPSQLQILHVGRGEDCFYYVMELADDAFGVPPLGGSGATQDRLKAELQTYTARTLKHELQSRGRLPPAECVQIGLALAEALQHLHSHGLVHRDIKPSNIIFVNSVPKLADIGLVTDVDASRSFVGTEGFLPPEGPGTQQGDIYSLGKVLYEAAMGRSRTDFPALPENWDALDAAEQARLLELNEVLVKVCEADPRRRYQTAEQLRADLELLHRGDSVRRQRAAEQRWKFAKKVGIAGAVGTLVVTGLVLIQSSLPQLLDPLTTGKNVGGYPPTAMRGTTNKEAWDHYRLGYFARRRLTDEGRRQAIQHFNHAIELDPKFALGYWGLWVTKFGDTWLLTHAETDEWRHLADKLVALDNALAETHNVLAFIRFWEWKWPEAEAECREALRLNPDCIHAWVCLGFYLSHVGRTDESLQVLERGLLVDPNWPQLVKMKGHAYFVRRQFQQALDLYLESVRREPLFTEARRWSARAYFAMTNYPLAIDELERHELLQGYRAPDQVKQEYAELRRAFQEGGARGYSLKQLDLTHARWKPDEYPYTFAQIYAGLGDKEQALHCLEKAYARHDELVYLIFDECWDPWRDDPRFEVIRKKVGLPRHPNFPEK